MIPHGDQKYLAGAHGSSIYCASSHNATKRCATREPLALGYCRRLRCSPTGRRGRTLAWWAAKDYAETSLQFRATNLFTSLLLVVLLFRAYVPVGFMPASGTPFLLEMCPATYQAQMPAHHGHHHSGTHTHFENCPFGSAPARRTDCAHRRLCAAGARRFSAPRRVRTAALQRTATRALISLAVPHLSPKLRFIG